MNRFTCLLFLPLLLLFGPSAPAQTTTHRFWRLDQPDSLYKARFWTAAGSGTVVYTGAMVGLYKAWYAGYPSSKFHFFNDNNEWNQMDKTGHFLMSYQESRWIAGGARWTGMRPRTAAWMGFAGSQLIQTSFEIFDGFSTQWGFSPGDVACNIAGSSLFLGQQLGWKEQRILLKMSAMPVRYSDARIYPVGATNTDTWTTLHERADALYGTSPIDLFLKNYNTLAVWASVNPRAFLGDDARWCPRWLNLAVGMGANNLFAGSGYRWNADKNCEGPGCLQYELDPVSYPRTRQFFLSLDIDYTRLNVKNRFLRTLLSAVNIIKFPAPTMEWTDHGQAKFHFVYF